MERGGRKGVTQSSGKCQNEVTGEMVFKPGHTLESLGEFLNVPTARPNQWNRTLWSSHEYQHLKQSCR